MPLAPSQFLLTHFDRLAEAPGGIAKLRALVLRLAVQGKLVPQNLSDEPAHKLIERVRATKKASQASRKDKLSDDTDAATPELESAIPRGWAVTSMADFALKITDGTHKTPNYVPKGVPFISVKDFSAGALSFANTRFISQEEHDALYRRCDPKRGDIIFGRIGTLGRAVLVDTDQPFSLFVSVGLVRFSQEHANLDYFKILLNSPFMTDQFEKIKVGGGSHTNKLNLGDLSGLTLMIPPLAEQRRIVAKVEELMVLCDALEAAQQEREDVRTRLRTSALHQLASPDSDSKPAAFVLQNLPRLAISPEDIAPLRSLIVSLAATGRLTGATDDEVAAQTTDFNAASDPQYPIAYGVLKPGPQYPGGTRLIKSQHIRDWQVAEHIQDTISPELDAEFKRTKIKGGEVLLNLVGASIGRSAVISDVHRGANVTRAVAVITPKQSVAAKYLVVVLTHVFTPERISDLCAGTAQPVLNIGVIRKLSIWLPPLAEQRRIVAKVDEIMAVLDALEATLTTARTTAERLLAATIAKLHAA